MSCWPYAVIGLVLGAVLLALAWVWFWHLMDREDDGLAERIKQWQEKR